MKMATTPILVFLNWTKEFHVHIDASSITIGVVLEQPGEGDIDHMISFSSQKLSSAENNYTTTERRVGNALRITKVSTLSNGMSFKDIH